MRSRSSFSRAGSIAGASWPPPSPAPPPSASLRLRSSFSRLTASSWARASSRSVTWRSMSTLASSSAVFRRSIFFWRNSGELTPTPLASIHSSDRNSTHWDSPPGEVASGYTSGRIPQNGDRHGSQRASLPVLAKQAQHDDVAPLAVVQVPGGQDALLHEAHALERAHRALVVRVRVGADALQAERPEAQRQDERLRLGVGARPPVGTAEPRADDRAPIAHGELRQAGDPDR